MSRIFGWRANVDRSGQGRQGREAGAHAADSPAGSSRRVRTRAALMSCAMKLVGSGRLPSVAEVALGAGVSRATAYRYFPSRSKLISAVVEESLGPVRRASSASLDGLERIRELFDKTFPRFRDFEPQLRAALQLALEHQAMERAGLLEEEPFRRGHRRRILAETAAPLKPLLGARRFERLLKAVSLVYGIESYVVLKDIWGCGDAEIARVARWASDALVEAALREAAPGRDRVNPPAPPPPTRAPRTRGRANRSPER